MKILFVGLKPNAALETSLLASGFSVRMQKAIPSATSDWIPDLIAYAPKNADQFEPARKLRALYPKTWLALVISRSEVNHVETLHALLREESKDDVWIKESWEHTFWFSLQAFGRQQRADNEVKRLKIERATLKRHREELTRHSNLLVGQLERDVDLASSIQRSLLPRFYPEIPGVSVAVKYIPAAGSGGDYYDIFEFGDKKRFGVLVADSQTHGMAASLLSVLVKVRLEEMKDRFPDSKSFMEFINHEISAITKDKAPLALLYGILDRSSLSFHFTVAGHLKPILWRAGKSVALAVESSPCLGDTDHYDFKENRVSLKPGDFLTFHTDGLNAVVQTSKRDTTERLLEILKKSGAVPDALSIQNELMALIDRFKSKKKLPDDLTLIHFSIHERTLYLATEKKGD